MLHGIDACLWPAVGWNALHNRLQVLRAYSNERVHWLSCNILIVLQRCDVSIADLVRRVRRIHITEFQFTLVNIFCLSMHDQHSTQEYAPLCEDHFVITIGGFDVLFRMFNNNLKLCLLLLLLLSLLLSYSVAVVIYILYYKQGPAKTELPSPGAQQHRSWTSTHMQPSAISQTLAHECLQQTSLPSM